MREFTLTEAQMLYLVEKTGISRNLLHSVLDASRLYGSLICDGASCPEGIDWQGRQREKLKAILPRLPSDYADKYSWKMQFLVNYLGLDAAVVHRILAEHLQTLRRMGWVSPKEFANAMLSLEASPQDMEHYYPGHLGSIDREAVLAEHLAHSTPIAQDRHAVVLTGPMCTGKTTIRDEQYGKGFLHLDAAELFVRLAGSSQPRFCGPYLAEVDAIGRNLFELAIRKGYNQVIEVIGSEANVLIAMISRLYDCGYKVDVQHVHAPLEECITRQAIRGDDNLSAYYTEGFHQSWVLGIPVVR